MRVSGASAYAVVRAYRLKNEAPFQWGVLKLSQPLHSVSYLLVPFFSCRGGI